MSNLNTFAESFMNDEELAQKKANALGVNLAKNYSELGNLVKQLASDTNGLSDADLKLLQSNKDLLESTDGYANSIKNIEKNINTLNSALDSIQKTIDRLKGAALGSTYSLNEYYKSMSETLALSAQKDTQAFKDSLDKTIQNSSVLFNSKNFTSTRDQQFAQLVAANQFGTLKDNTLTQIDYLKQIEQNTKDQITAILEVVNALGAKVNTALFPNESVVNQAYKSVLGREAESAGSNYWQGQISSGNVSSSNIGVSIGTAGVENSEISRADYVTQLYTKGLGRTPTSAEVDYWANKSKIETVSLASTFKKLDPNFKYFANGGIVTSPTMGLIGEAGYDEAVIPLKDSNDPLSQKAVLEELKSIKAELASIKQYNYEIENNTKGSRYAS